LSSKNRYSSLIYNDLVTASNVIQITIPQTLRHNFYAIISLQAL